MEALEIDQIHDESVYEVSEKDQDNEKLVKTKQMAGEIEFDKLYQAVLFIAFISHISVFLWMLLLSLKPGRSISSASDLDRGYSILAVVSMVCYVTGLFALHWKRAKCQAVFLGFIATIIITNVIVGVVYQQEENVQYLSVAVFLLVLNLILFVKAIQVYKKMKALENFAYSNME